jgi:hypothetical protein
MLIIVKVICFNPGKEILLTIRVYVRVTGGYGGDGKFSFVVLPVIQISKLVCVHIL